MTNLTRENAIASRTFQFADSDSKHIEILIGKPEEIQHKEWVCRYRICGDGIDVQYQIHAIDGVQALQLVFAVIESVIIGADLNLLWNGSPDLGLVRR